MLLVFFVHYMINDSAYQMLCLQKIGLKLDIKYNYNANIRSKPSKDIVNI